MQDGHLGLDPLGAVFPLSMENKLHLNKQMEAAEGGSREVILLDMLTESIRGLEAVRRGRDHPGNRTAGGGGRCTGEEAVADEKQEEREWKQKALGVLRELSVSQSSRAAAWREALRGCACILHTTPPGGGEEQHPSTTDFSSTFLSVVEDVENINDKLNAVITKLDAGILQLGAEEKSPVEQRDPEPSAQVEDHLNPRGPHEAGQEQQGPGSPSHQTPASESSVCRDGAEAGRRLEVKGQGSDNEDVSPENNIELEDSKTDKREETNKEWITVGLSAHLEGSRSNIPDVCFIRAPVGVAEVLTCEVADTFSCLMVASAEELVSRVIRVGVQEGAGARFPFAVVVPFCARYRGNYRSVAVKIVDGERRASYIAPVATEGTYGGQRGSFAEVKVYSLGLFAVVSCLKRENYTVPRRGVSHKLPMDPRICLNYLPGSFAAPVMAQSAIQPVDAVLLAAAKTRSDAYHWVVSTSPLLYLTHPSSQPLRRPLTITLPCPPNADKKRYTRGQRGEEEEEHRHHNGPQPNQPSSHRMRTLVPSVQKEASSELLCVLGWRDRQWSVLEKVVTRNQQVGLASFELTESYDRLLVIRLLAPLQPCDLASLAEELEASVCRHAVTVVLHRRPDEPHSVLVAALPSRDLGWESSKLQAQGYRGRPETSAEVSMGEGDQLLLRLCGNITSTAAPINPHGVLQERLTFHSQRRNHLVVQLTEVDPFGNYSSPHYKGTAMFYKVTRGQVEWRGDGPAPMDLKLLGDPVCRLSLTLPKKVKSIRRPVTTRVKLCGETGDSLSDSLLLWLSAELSEEDTALLALSLRLRRSAAQLVKLRAGDGPSTQAFHILAMWRRGLPAAQHQAKASQLAHCLAKSGRPDLAGELLLRQAAATRQCSV